MFLNSQGDYIVSGLVSRGLWQVGQVTKVSAHAEWIKKTLSADSQADKAPVAKISTTSKQIDPTLWVSLSGANSSSPEGISPQKFNDKWKVLSNIKRFKYRAMKGFQPAFASLSLPARILK